MKIALVSDYFPPHRGGGVERVVGELAQRIAARGHEVLVLALTTEGGARHESADGVNVTRFKCSQLTSLVGSQLSFSLEATSGIQEQLEDFRPDVVNAHNRFFTTTPMAVRASNRLGIPVVTTLHLGSLAHVRGWQGSAARAYEKVVGRRIVSSSDAVVAVGSSVAEHARDLGAREATVYTIPNGIELRDESSELAGTSGVRGVFVGRLIGTKGPDLLLEALGAWPDRPDSLIVDFVGDGPMRRTLQRKVETMGLESTVTLLGFHEDIPGLLRNYDFLVRPSYLEGLPLVALEALDAGIPSIMSDVGATRDAVVDGSSGILTRPGSRSSLLGALRKLTADPELRRRMGGQARSRAETWPTWNETAGRTIEVFEATASSADV